MESLTEKENELRKAAEGGNYWDILNLADFFYEQGKYEEAEEWYLKIAGENDTSGDANKNYSLMLLELERFDEAIKYVDIIVQNGADTIVMDVILEKIDSIISNLDHPIWKKISVESFGTLAWDFQYTIKHLKEDDIEKILLDRKKSENEAISKSAEFYLFQMYFSGYCFFEFTVWTPGKQNFEKALKYAYVTLYDYEEYYGGSEMYSYSAIIEELDTEKAELFHKGIIDSIMEKKGCTVDEALEEINYMYYDGLNTKYVPFGATTLLPCVYRYGDCEDVILPDTISVIDDCAFENCTSLSSINLPNGLTKILFHAFENCVSLESIVLPNTVQCIGEGVFEGCENLKSITIPNSVTEIHGWVFFNCSSLETIYCEAPEQPEGWDESWSFGCDAQVIWGYKK